MITQEMIDLYGRVWWDTPEGEPGARRRAALEAVEPLIRADEHEHVVRVSAEMFDNLRAQIEALHAEALKWQQIREEQGYRDTAALFAVEAEAYADVLALFGGSDG